VAGLVHPLAPHVDGGARLQGRHLGVPARLLRRLRVRAPDLREAIEGHAHAHRPHHDERLSVLNFLHLHGRRPVVHHHLIALLNGLGGGRRSAVAGLVGGRRVRPGLALRRLAPVVEILLIVLEALARLLRRLRFGLRLLDFANGVLNARIGLVDDALGLLQRLLPKLVPLLLNRAELFFVALLRLFGLLAGRLGLVQLVLQLLRARLERRNEILHRRLLRARQLAGPLQQIVRESHAPGNLEGVRRARHPFLVPIGGTQRLLIEFHGPVLDALRLVGVHLERAVVGGGNGAGARRRQPFEHRLRQRSALVRVRASARLVDQDERIVAPRLQHVPQVRDVRAKGRQVVLNRLLVANVRHNPVEQRKRGVRRHRQGQTVGEHQRKQPDGLHRDRLSARVGARDDERVEIVSELKVERHDVARRNRSFGLRGTALGLAVLIERLEV